MLDAMLPADTPISSNDLLLKLTSQIVSSYVGNNAVAPEKLPTLMADVYKNLGRLNQTGGSLATRPEPAVPVKSSVMPNYIVCLEDGKKLKMLKRHLKTAYNMTPEQYRERWGLPADYPMVAPDYAKQRSRLAKEIGLGKERTKTRKKAA